jgi:outer membrane lipoprotein-sorting protein
MSFYSRMLPITLIWLMVGLPLLFSVAAKDATEAVDAREVIRKMDLLMRGDSSFGSYRMTITDPDWERTLTLNAWELRTGKKTFIQILSPAKEAGIVTLKIDFEMWNYLPRVERIVKIPPSMMLQPWMGSDFTNDDLVKASSIVADYSHEILAEETISGHDAYKVELIPNPDAPVVWGRIFAWVRKSDSMPLRQEFFAEDGELIRVLRFDNIREVRGREVPTYWEMIPVGEKGRQTVMEVLDLEIDAEIDESIFTLRNLKLNN